MQMKPISFAALSWLMLAPAPLLAAEGMPVAVASGSAEPESVVIQAGALPGATIDPGKLPVDVQTLTGADLDRFGATSALAALGRSAAGVSFADAQEIGRAHV